MFFTPGLTFLDSLWLGWFPDTNTAAHHAPQADTCDTAAPPCLHLGSRQKCSEACVAAGVCVLSCVLYTGHKVTQLIIQAAFLLLSE